MEYAMKNAIHIHIYTHAENIYIAISKKKDIKDCYAAGSN